MIKTINLKGKIKTGARVLLLDSNNKVVSVLPNYLKFSKIKASILKMEDKNVKSLLFFHKGHLGVRNNDIFCMAGRRKFFHPISEDLGVLVFASVHWKDRIYTEKEFKKNYVIAKYLEKLDMFPKIISKCIVELDCDISNIKRKSNIYAYENFKLKGTAFGILMKRVFSPVCRGQIDNKKHMDVMKFAYRNPKMWPMQIPRKSLSDLYGDSFTTEHAEFRKRCYKGFVDDVLNRCFKDEYLKKNRIHKRGNGIPDYQYGNILYCLKSKKWYFIDFE